MEFSVTDCDNSVPIIDSTIQQRNSSFGGRWDTTLIQYTVVVPEEYLQKFDDPYHFHDCTLDIYQKPPPINQPRGIYQAIKEASGIPDPESGLKRKALRDITDASHNRVREPKCTKHEEDNDGNVIVVDD
jgi:hypothetical protein